MQDSIHSYNPHQFIKDDMPTLVDNSDIAYIQHVLYRGKHNYLYELGDAEDL